MAAERSIARVAFAKINLELRVLGVRTDGYHELRTTFQSIALADALTFTPAAGPFRIVCDDPACPSDERNLVWRAAQLVWKAARRKGPPRDVIVTIAKRIPVQAGLGGGSSDGAAAILACASLWRVRLTRRQMHRLARSLGADVPYFLEGGTMLGVERGDQLSRQPDRPRAWVVLAVPRFGVSTQQAFAWWDQMGRKGGKGGTGRMGRTGRTGGMGGTGGTGGMGGMGGKSRTGKTGRHGGQGRITNDLQLVVAKRHRVVAKLVAALERQGAFQASLSGSGSAVFGLFRRRAQAIRAARALRRQGPRRLVTVTRTLDRAECRELAAK